MKSRMLQYEVHLEGLLLDLTQMFPVKDFYLLELRIYYVLGSGALKMNMMHSCYLEVSLLGAATNKSKYKTRTVLSLGHGTEEA